MYLTYIPAVAVILSSALASALPAVPLADTPGVNVLATTGNQADVIANSWIITYKAGISEADTATHHREIKAKLGKAPDAVFSIGTFKGVHINTNAAGLVQIGKSSLIQHVERDMIVRLDPTTEVVAPNITSLEARALTSITTSFWGLSRISHRNYEVGTYHYVFDYPACVNTRAYILDTGIYTAHVDLSPRASVGINYTPSTTAQDVNGHGTHMAGTILGTTAGVCKGGGQAISVKVLDDNGAGTISNVIKGIIWAHDHASAAGLLKRSVQMLAIGGAYNSALNSIVNNVAGQGMTMVTGSGSSGSIATSSPASAVSAITVAAVDSVNNLALFSNVGAGLDVLAPGVGITSAFPGPGCNLGGAACWRTLSGTASAAAHIAGLAMYYIAKDNLAGSSAVAARLQTTCSKGVVKGNLGGGPNCLAYNGSGK